MTVSFGGRVFNGLDDSWNVVMRDIQSMPDALIEPHKKRLSELFQIHAATLQAEIEKRLPVAERGEVSDLLSQTMDMAQKGQIRESLRNLAVGVLLTLPERGNGYLDKRLVGLIEQDYADKAIALMNSTDRNSPGIMPATLRLMFKEPDMDAATFYRTHTNWIFPENAKVTPVIPQLLLK